MLVLILTMIIAYIAAPTYGIIRDAVGPGQAVFILSSPLPGAHMNRPERGIIERIHDFLFPAKEVPVPVLQRIDLKGRVVYTDKAPYVNGIIELKSAPRYTRTDDGGYFVFIDIEEGAHIISVLDEGGNVLARCDIEIERTIEVTDVQLVYLSDGTLVFQVAVDIKVLEITLVLRTDADGRVTGLDMVYPGLAPAGPGEPPPPDMPPGPPIPPVEPEKPQGGPNPPPPLPPDDNFDVYDTVATVRYGREGAVNVNIFGAQKRIAPGMKGGYQFTVDNAGNDYTSSYDVAFTAADTLPAAKKIPMLYRLKADGVYVAGNDGAWCTPQELYQDTALARGKHVKYTLDWYWPEGENDNDFAQFGGNPGYSYSLIIKVTAQKQ